MVARCVRQPGGLTNRSAEDPEAPPTAVDPVRQHRAEHSCLNAGRRRLAFRHVGGAAKMTTRFVRPIMRGAPQDRRSGMRAYTNRQSRLLFFVSFGDHAHGLCALATRTTAIDRPKALHRLGLWLTIGASERAREWRLATCTFPPLRARSWSIVSIWYLTLTHRRCQIRSGCESAPTAPPG